MVVYIEAPSSKGAEAAGEPSLSRAHCSACVFPGSSREYPEDKIVPEADVMMQPKAGPRRSWRRRRPVSLQSGADGESRFYVPTQKAVGVATLFLASANAKRIR